MDQTAIEELLKGLRQRNILSDFSRVGSRVTCTPAPTNTDDDYLLLAASCTAAASLQYTLAKDGWEFPDPSTDDEAEYEHAGSLEFTARYDSINLICTSDPAYYHHWLLARDVCHALNLMDKKQRKLVHQIICGDI